MNFIIDGQISEKFCPWIFENYGFETVHIKSLGLQFATDMDVFGKARQKNAILITKDRDFLELLERKGPPPQVIWVTCGNTSNKRLREIFASIFEEAVKLIESGKSLVEISDTI